jgi:hypothetical protein
MGWFRLTLLLAARSVVHPRDGVALMRLAWRFRRRRWFLRPPFLPLPARDYMRWRMYTAYGDERHVPRAGEIVRFARWATRD